MTSVTTTCRDISKLKSNAELACRLLFQECYKAGITNIFITETYRSQARQNYLYEQGRSRKGNIVTWTKSSRHTSKLAWDIAVAPPNSLYDIGILTRVGEIAKKLGITWGGSWKNNIDRPHFEVTSNWTMPKGYKIEGTVVVPSNSKLKVQLIIKDEVNKEVETNKPVEFLTSTGRAEYKQMIQRGVEEGLFSSKHEGVDSYTDGQLASYAAAYINRKLKTIK